jgi:hypothetical protein
MASMSDDIEMTYGGGTNYLGVVLAKDAWVPDAVPGVSMSDDVEMTYGGSNYLGVVLAKDARLPDAVATAPMSDDVEMTYGGSNYLGVELGKGTRHPDAVPTAPMRDDVESTYGGSNYLGVELGKGTRLPDAVPTPQLSDDAEQTHGVMSANDTQSPNAVPACHDDCNFRGLCALNACYCQPGYYGVTCEFVEASNDRGFTLLQVLTICIAFAVIAFSITFLCLLHGNERKQQLQAFIMSPEPPEQEGKPPRELINAVEEMEANCMSPRYHS